MENKIVKVDKFPLTTYDIYRQSEKDHKEVLKGASLEIPWKDGHVVLKKLVGGWVDNTLTNKTNAIKNKIKIEEVPCAYKIKEK